MYHPDGSIATQASLPLPVIHIGWLDSEQPYARGHVAAHDRTRLVAFCQRPLWYSLGSHTCSLCLPAAYVRLPSGQPLGAGTFYVVAATCIYTCPDLIIHYVNDHDYAPPTDFLRALHTCPLPTTPWYADLVRRYGLND